MKEIITLEIYIIVCIWWSFFDNTGCDGMASELNNSDCWYVTERSKKVSNYNWTTWWYTLFKCWLYCNWNIYRTFYGSVLNGDKLFNVSWRLTETIQTKKTRFRVTFEYTHTFYLPTNTFKCFDQELRWSYDVRVKSHKFYCETNLWVVISAMQSNKECTYD